MPKTLISFDEIAESNPNFLDVESRPDWRGLFANDHPLNLEVGFGTGNFLIEMAVREPGTNFIGMDFYHRGIRKTITRIEKLQLTNLRVVYGDAREKVPLIFADGELKRIYINFPDPWPKKRHTKRRLIKPPFVRDLVSKLETGGELRIATDSEPYAREIINCLEQDPELNNKTNRWEFTEAREDIPKTKYEKTFINAGKNIYYLEFFKSNRYKMESPVP